MMRRIKNKYFECVYTFSESAFRPTVRIYRITDPFENKHFYELHTYVENNRYFPLSSESEFLFKAWEAILFAKENLIKHILEFRNSTLDHVKIGLSKLPRKFNIRLLEYQNPMQLIENDSRNFVFKMNI